LLIQALKDRDCYIRKITALCLEYAGPLAREAAPALREVHNNDTDRSVQEAARLALAAILEEDKAAAAVE